MAIIARPNLEDNFFKQLDDSVLTLSGNTKFASITGLSINDGDGVFIPIITTGGTTGDALTFINNQLVLRPSGAGATPLFDSVRPTTRVGVPVVTANGTTVQQFLECYFFPAVGPSSSLSVLTGGNDREFGDVSVGNLSWGIVKNTNTISEISISSNGLGTYNCSVVPTGISQSGTASYTYPSGCASPTSACTTTNVYFSISARTTSGETTSSNATIVWRNKNYNFSNSTLYTGSTINVLLSGTTGVLSTGKTLSTTMTFVNQFFYYAYPKTYGTPSFIVNGLPNNAWGSSVGGTLFTTTFVNNNGYSNQYYVARSENKITGTYTIVVS